jgi:hypothetical protein
VGCCHSRSFVCSNTAPLCRRCYRCCWRWRRHLVRHLHVSSCTITLCTQAVVMRRRLTLGASCFWARVPAMRVDATRRARLSGSARMPGDVRSATRRTPALRRDCLERKVVVGPLCSLSISCSDQCCAGCAKGWCPVVPLMQDDVECGRRAGRWWPQPALLYAANALAAGLPCGTSVCPERLIRSALFMAVGAVGEDYELCAQALLPVIYHLAYHI